MHLTRDSASLGAAARTSTPLPSPRAGERSDSVEILRTEEELAALQSEWTELYDTSEHHNPFLSHGWTLGCRSVDRTGAQPFVVLLRQGGRLVGLAPLCVETRRGLRMLRFIADDRSDYLGFLCDVRVPKVEQTLLERIMGMPGWDLVLLRRLTDSYTSLHRSPLPTRVKSHCVKWTSAPFLRGDGEWDDFHKSGPSWLREMRKRSRRFLRDGHTAELFSGVEAIDWLERVAEIEQRSWKGRNHTTRLQPSDGADLLRTGFETVGNRGEMELGLAFIGGQPVAFQIDFTHADRTWHYQCAYDEAFADARAGSVLAYLSLQRAWDRGVREFDYLSGDEPYKLQRTNGSRSIYQLAIHPRSARGWISYALLAGARSTLREVAVLRALYDSAKTFKRSIRKSAN